MTEDDFDRFISDSEAALAANTENVKDSLTPVTDMDSEIDLVFGMPNVEAAPERTVDFAISTFDSPAPDLSMLSPALAAAILAANDQKRKQNPSDIDEMIRGGWLG